MSWQNGRPALEDAASDSARAVSAATVRPALAGCLRGSMWVGEELVSSSAKGRRVLVGHEPLAMAVVVARCATHCCPELEGEAMLRLRTNAMTIGQLSRRSGLSIKSLREYERLGFLYTLGRSESNYRLFGEETLWCVRAVQGLRSLGLTLKEIQDLLRRYAEDAERPYLPMGDFLDVPLVQSLTRVEARIADLEALRQRILEFQATYIAGTDDRVVSPSAAGLAHLFEAGTCHICASSAS